MTLHARDARPEDHPTFARLFLELGVPDPTPTSAEFEARICPHSFFLWQAELPVAYAFWQALGAVARVVHVIVDPAARGRGVGTELMRELASRARAAGCARWELHVKPDNVPALRLYERSGMRAVGPSVAMRIAWADAARLPAAEGLRALQVVPEDDARVESGAGLLAGQIAVQRAGGGRVFLALEQAGSIVAFASFDPSFPGAFPFVARSPDLAGALLAAMRPHALPQDAAVRLVATEGAVVRALIEAGAETLLEILRMEGPIAL